jgi:hypothetical protein
MDILEQMRMGTQARFLIKMRKFEIMLRPLTVFETVSITGEVNEELSRRPDIARNAITEHVIFSIKSLEKASTSAPNRGDPKLTAAVLQDLSPDELAFLFKEYCAGVDRINPSMETISMERVNELVELAKKNNSVLIELSFLELVNVCRVLLSQQQMAK